MDKKDIKILINCFEMMYDIMGSFNNILDFLMSLCIGKDYDDSILLEALNDTIKGICKLNNEILEQICNIKNNATIGKEVKSSDLIILDIFELISSNLTKSIDIMEDCIVYYILLTDIEESETNCIHRKISDKLKYAKLNNKTDELFENLIEEIKALLSEFNSLFNNIMNNLL